MREYDEGWISHLWRFHWQLYAIGTFAKPVSDEHARRAGEEFIQSLGEDAFGCVMWGEGAIGGRFHVHLLLGGVWKGRVNTKSWGTNQVALNIKLVKKKWPHGVMSKVERFDPSRRSTYLVDHHEVEIVGKPKHHRRR
jgi:hypothetical protein